LEQQDDRLRLEAALDRLPEMYRRALVAHFIDGLSIREIACGERVPVGTILSRIHKGKQLVREAWELAPVSPQADVRMQSSPKPERPLSEQTQDAGGNQRHTTESPDPTTWER
jgi:hypothetical protein